MQPAQLSLLDDRATAPAPMAPTSLTKVDVGEAVALLAPLIAKASRIATTTTEADDE